MTTSPQIASTTLALSEGELFGGDPSAVLDEREMQLLMEDFLGVALAGPARVSIGERGALPLVIGLRQTGLRAWEVLRDANARLVAWDLDAREVSIGTIFRDAKLEEYPPLEQPERARPDEISAASVSALVRRIDARAILELPWRPARYRLWVLVYDWISNAVDVELVGDRPPPPGRPHIVYPRPPEIEVVSFLDEPTMPDRVKGRPTLPSYLGFGEAPPQDPLPNLRFEIAPDPSRGSELLLSGSFALVAEAAHVPSPSFMLPEVDAAEHPVRGIVPITFAIVGLDWRAPAAFEVAAPVYGVWAAQPGELLAGYFMLDVTLELDSALLPGSHRAWAILEGQVFGPVTLTQG